MKRIRMLGIKDFKTGIQIIWDNKLDYFFLFFQLIFFSRLIKQMKTDEYLVIHLIISFVFVVFKNRLKYVDKYFLLIIGFVILNIFPVARFGFNLTVFGGYIIRLSIAFLIVIYFSVKFLDVFENLVFILAFISIPLYIIQLIIPSVFESFSFFYNSVLIDEHLLGKSRYLLIFFINGSGLYSNSGFMGEPSRYVILLAWALLIHLYNNGFKFDAKFRVYILAFITAFSTGGLIYLSLLFLLFINFNFGKKVFKNIFKLSILIVLLFYLGLQIPIVQKQKEQIISEIFVREQENYEKTRAGVVESGGVSRVTGAVLNVEYFIKWPLGYGLNMANITGYQYLGSSPNGLSMLIVTFGIGFLIFLFISSKKLVIILKNHNCAMKTSNTSFSLLNLKDFLTMLIIVLPLSGHSVGNDPFTFAFLLWPLFFYPYFKNKNMPLFNTKQ